MNVSPEALWIRFRTHLYLILPIAGIAGVIFGALELYSGPSLLLNKPNLYRTIETTLPHVDNTTALAFLVVGFGLAAFSTRKR